MKIDSRLATRMDGAGDAEKIPVIISLGRHEDVGLLKQMGVEPTIVYESIASIAANVTARQVKDLASMSEVTLVELDAEGHALR